MTAPTYKFSEVCTLRGLKIKKRAKDVEEFRFQKRMRAEDDISRGGKWNEDNKCVTGVKKLCSGVRDLRPCSGGETAWLGGKKSKMYNADTRLFTHAYTKKKEKTQTSSAALSTSFLCSAVCMESAFEARCNKGLWHVGGWFVISDLIYLHCCGKKSSDSTHLHPGSAIS